MIKTVQVYLKKDNSYLLMYRNKKPNDMSEGKWIGIGGHVEKGETIDEAVIRETKEETGLTVHNLKCNGEVHFINDDYEEMMYVYLITDFSGELKECNEGELHWVDIDKMLELPMWDGDRAYLPLLRKESPYFKYKIIYKHKNLVTIESII